MSRLSGARRGVDLLEHFLGLYFHDPAVGLLRAAEAEIVARWRTPSPVLDVGCGDGSFASACLNADRAIGLDRSLSRARAALASGAYAAVVVADAHRLPFRDGAFAAVLSNSTLEHIPGVGDVLREVARCSRPRARLLFTFHNHRFAERMFFWPRLFALLGRPQWTERYRLARLRRLGMANLMHESEWRQLLESCGLAACGVQGYLRGPTNDAFEALLVLARFGMGRANLAAGLRLADGALARLGVVAHRPVIGKLLARLLRAIATRHQGEPAAIAIEAAHAEVGGGVVVELSPYRRASRDGRG